MATKKQKRPTRTEREKKHARDSDEGAKALVAALKPMHRPEAEKYVSENLPSIAVIVGMAFYRQTEAAKKPRRDALQALIEKIVVELPKITSPELLNALRTDGGRVIEEITQEDIYFIEGERGGNVAKISGLKDRLYRAKKAKLSR